MASEQPSWQEAERVSGKRLDRRRTYTIMDGEVWVDIRYSTSCSGCNEVGECVPEPYRGSGCHECGYTGRVRLCVGVPISLAGFAIIGDSP